MIRKTDGGRHLPEVLQVSVDGNTLTDELTITDPEVLAKTWNRTLVYRPQNTDGHSGYGFVPG